MRAHWHHLSYVLREIMCTQGSTSSQTRLPITTEIMATIQSILFNDSSTRPVLERHLLWAACCLGFFGFLRSGEFTRTTANSHPLLASDFSVDAHNNPTTVPTRKKRPLRERRVHFPGEDSGEAVPGGCLHGHSPKQSAVLAMSPRYDKTNSSKLFTPF